MIWNRRFNYYDFVQGLNYASDSAITFHYVSAAEMYVYEYFLYHLRLHKIRRINEKKISANDA